MKVSMIRKTVCAGIAAIILASVSTAQADSAVWQVSNDRHTLYLGGTIHALRASDYPLPAAFDQAYKQSKLVIFETDLAELSSPETQIMMQQALRYPQGDSLKRYISEPLYQKLLARWQSMGLPPQLMASFRPGGIAMTMTMMELQRIGVTAQGIDEFFHQQAVGDRKPVAGLESVAEQVGFLAEMGEGDEDVFLEGSLEELDQSQSFMDELIAAWRKGDQADLERLILTDMRKELPTLYQSLIVQRNNDWLPQIRNMLRTPETELVLVGSGHLVGTDGLLYQLEKLGYRVKQLP
ncbi:MAG: TraB/GumN family protein [Amphritea sp.]|nr:TraB/GumN family protein [Amphritea sp.]